MRWRGIPGGVNVAEYPYLLWFCEACGKKRLWKTAWGIQPHIRCENSPTHMDLDMDVEFAIPAGALLVQDERVGMKRYFNQGVETPKQRVSV